MAHTPGPWTIHDEEYCQDEIYGDLRGPMEDGRIVGTQVCFISEAESEKTRLANARLIAAAPDLLAALKELDDAADVFAADQSHATDKRCGEVQPVTVAECEALNAALAKARAAIRKAEGE